MTADILLLTERLVLRPVSLEDLEDIHRLHSLPETDRYNTMGIPAGRAETEANMNAWFGDIAQHKKHVFCIADKQHTFIGVAGMNIDRPRYAKAEVWYKFFPEYWGKGFATETVERLLQFGFGQLALHRIEAGCATENAASARVLEKTGFLKEGLCRKVLPIRGEWKDGFNFAILKEDWLHNN